MAQQQSLDNIPYYPYDYAYAVKHDEVDQWKKEQEIAPAAKQLFQNAVNASYDGVTLWTDNALVDLFMDIGAKRTIAIIVSTVNSAYDGDIRYTAKTRKWAKKWADKHFNGNYVNKNLIVHEIHPGLINILAESLSGE